MKNNRKRVNKIRNLVGICTLCAIVLTVSTYAWFIGMKTVNVSSFDIRIATTEGLFLSMDGETWTYQLDVKNAPVYTSNTNVWAEEGLVPVSSVGDMDATSSTMKLFEKGSLTTTKGGYRLLTSRVHNEDGIEEEGYVAFDLFVKNVSGAEYYVDNEPLNEEAIYLTTNSAVTVAADGEANTGIENSVRVAFAQVGRVIGTTGDNDGDDITDITGITCESTNVEGHAQVTGICRSAQIWEPNDKAHVQNAINWYDESCLPRKADGTDVTLSASYDTSGATCTAVTTSQTVPTYAISRVIGINDNVDVYDGEAYNQYTANTKDYATYVAARDAAAKADATEEQKNAYADMKLVNYPYFTDTDKDKLGMERPTFMTLAPNSITKVRVYIYIEGQDVDNYDFASLGKKISVNFGFTKERFTEDDVNHVGPSTEITPVEYTATGVISDISVDGITYDATNHYFLMNTEDSVTSFTFTDDGTAKVATRTNGNWFITDSN